MDEDTTLLAAIGVQIASKREEAKGARGSSGIESTWRECEEAYLGIDDVNRHEFTDAKWAKPMSMDGPVTTGRKPRDTDYKSTVFHRLTSRYVDAGVAKLTEILLPADDKSFSFSEMPVPERIAASEDESQVVHSGLGNAPLTRPLAPGETPPPAAPQPPVAAVGPAPAAPAAMPPGPQASAPPTAASPAPPAGVPGAAPTSAAPQVAPPPRMPLTVQDLAREAIEAARKKAKAAETRIYDWQTETQYRAEIRKVISDAARIGVGVLKAPTPVSKRVMAITKAKEGDGIDLTIKEKIVPAGVWCDPWNIYPDPACGENIHDGDYIFECDFMSARQVRGLKKLPGYIKAQIDLVLEQGPNKANETSTNRPEGTKSKDRYTVWYFYGTLTKDEMQAIDRASGKEQGFNGDEEANVIVTLINDSVVRATINPLDSGSFPYHSMPWQRRAQHWAGVGVAEQMRAPQRIVNAAIRALLNNAGKSAGCQIFLREGAFRPGDGTWQFTPDKFWYQTENGSDDIRKDFVVVEIPNVGEQLTNIITLAERFAEEVTSIPLITQGQSGATTPDTFGAAQLQNNNANQLLRSIGYTFDDKITEPATRQFYEWLLLDPDVPNKEKGEFQINAHGSSALVERAIQDQTIGQMAALVLNPAYKFDPAKWAAEYARSKKLDPKTFQYTEEEQARMAAAPPPEQPAVTVAKINADTQLKLGAMKQTVDELTEQHEAQIAAAAHTLEVGRAQAEDLRTKGELTINAHDLEMQHQREMLKYATMRNISLDTVKAELAKAAMTLQTQRQLNAEDNAVDLHKHHNPVQRPELAQRPRGAKPPGQTPGRAGSGRAFEQGAPQ